MNGALVSLLAGLTFSIPAPPDPGPPTPPVAAPVSPGPGGLIVVLPQTGAGSIPVPGLGSVPAPAPADPPGSGPGSVPPGQVLGNTGTTVGGALGTVGNAVGGPVGGAVGSAGGAVGSALDLSGWKLTTPTANDHGGAGLIAHPATDDTGPWLDRRGGRLRFWAPVHGATTPNSTHARSELVSLHNFPAGQGRHVLTVSCSVDQVPRARPDIIIGQIHGADSIKSSSFAMLHYDGGLIRVTVKHGTSGTDNDQHKLVSGIPLGAPFDYTLTDNGDGTIGFSVTYNGHTRSDRAAIPGGFTGQPVRFQAGDYQQASSSGGGADDSGGGQDGGRVTFYQLREAHPGGDGSGSGKEAR